MLLFYSNGRKQEPFHTGFTERDEYFGQTVMVMVKCALATVGQVQTAPFAWMNSYTKVQKKQCKTGTDPL